jgi:hypothetical protein
MRFLTSPILLQTGMNCMARERNKNKKVPGCTKRNEESGFNLCYRAARDELAFLGDDTSADAPKSENRNFWLPKCRGDCDTDWDCKVSIIGHRSFASVTSVLTEGLFLYHSRVWFAWSARPWKRFLVVQAQEQKWRITATTQVTILPLVGHHWLSWVTMTI